MEDGGMEELTGQNPLPVEVNPCKAGPIVATNHSVGV